MALYKRNYWLLLICACLISSCFAMQNNTLPLYILELSGTSFHVGIMAGISSLTALFFRPAAGYFLDKIGRTLVFRIGIFLYLTASVGYMLAPNILLLLISRGVYGLGLCAATSAIAAIASDIMRDKLLSALYTITVIQTVGGLATPAIAIFLTSAIGFRQTYAVAGAGFLLALLVAFQMNYEKHLPDTTQDIQQPKADRNKLSVMIEVSALFPALCMLFHGIAHSSIAGFVASYGKTIGIENVGFFFIINGLVTFTIRPVLIRYSDSEYNNKVFGTGICFFAGALILFVFAANSIWLAVASVFFTIGYNATQPLLNSLALMNAPVHRRGAANATYYILWDFGYGIGSIALGAVAVQLGYSSIYIIGIFALVLLAAVFYCFVSKTAHTQRQKVGS